MIKEKETMGRFNNFSELNLRIIFGLLALFIITCITFFSNEFIWQLMTLLISSYAFIEWSSTFEKRKINILFYYLVFIILGYYFLNVIDVIFFKFSVVFFTSFFIIYIILILYKLMLKNKFFWLANSYAINIYLFLFLNYFFNERYNFLLFLSFIFICDTSSYFLGKKFGKNSFTSISPKKTIEGLTFGLFFSVISISTLINIFFEKSPLFSILMAIIIFFTSVIGDLYFSIFKRTYKIKDYAKIIPGHGGLLDRLDSIFLNLPLFILLIY
jgi:phosphatidate cytidylyltransferase